MKKADARFIEKVRRAVEGLDVGNGFILAAFSGGADSTAMVCACIDVFGADHVRAMHVNHGIRGAEADADEKFCENFCRERGIVFYSAHVDVLSASGGKCDEDTARRLRYEALISKAKETGARAIATAHTSSDNAETVIQSICRGCGISGLGIPPVRDDLGVTIIRPLLFCSRGEVEEFLGGRGVSYVTDSTNLDNAYTRNFVRHVIIPELTKVNDQAIKNISELSERARCDEDYIDTAASAFASGKTADDTASLSSLHTAVLMRVLMKLISRHTEATQSYERLKALCALVKSGKNGDSQQLSGGISAVVSDGRLRFVPSDANFCDDEAHDASNGYINEKMGYSVSFSAPAGTGERVYEASISSDDAKILVARARKADKYVYGKMTRTVKKLTSGVPQDARARRPVICAGDQVIWYPGYPVANGHIGDTKIYYIEKIL